MPTWKKVVISGSGVAQLSNDANYLAQSGTGAILTGSFTGSFTGDGSGLTGVVAAGTISSSAQIASDISGAFVAPSQSIASDISALQSFSSSLDSTFASEAELNASSSTLQSNIDSAISTANSELNASSSVLQSNIDGAISTANSELNASSSVLQSNIDGAISTANTELNASSSALTTAYTSADTTLSSSLAADIATNKANIDALGDTYATDAELNASSSTLQTNIDSVESTARIELNDSGSTLQTNIDNLSSSLETRVTDNSVNLTGAVDRITAQEQFSSSVDTAINFSDQDVTIVGNLTVSGTTTTVNSTTLEIDDNIIALNGTGATNAGLVVNDPSGPASGSLIWKGNDNAWFAGGEGSEEKVLLSKGDGILSGSAQIAADISGSFTSTSASLAADIATNKASIDALGDTYATDAELNASSSTLQTNIDSAISTANTELNASSSVLQSNIDGVQSNLDTASGSLAGRIATIEGDNATLTQLNASSSVLQVNIDGVQSNLDTASGSLASRLATIEGDNATQTELDAVSSSLAADISGLGDTYATDAELNASSSTLQTNIDNAISVANSELNDSGSTLQTNIDNLSSSLETRVTDNSVNLTSAIDRIGAQENFSGSLSNAISFSDQDVTVAGNLTVNGTGSFAYIQSTTGSAKYIGDAYIVVNNDTPSERYAGIKVFDSGSANTTASLEFDGQTNDWFYEYSDDGGATKDHGVLLFGPEYATKGSPVYPTNNALLKGTGGHHLSASLVTDDGSTIGLGANTSVTGNITVTGTVDGIDLQAFSGSAATRITDLENFSSSLDNTFASEAELNASSSALTTAYETADTNLSASLATDIAANAANLSNLTSGELNSGSFSVSLHPDSGSIAFTEGLEIGDVYDQGNGTTDIRVPEGAAYVELNYGDTDFIYLDGDNAGIQINTGGGAIEWTYYGASGLLNAPGEIRIPAANVFSGSLLGTTVTAGTINGTINADNGVVSSSAQTIDHLAGTSIVSSSAQTIANLGGSGVVSASAEGDAQGQIKLNGVNVDINALGASDSPTFNNLIVNGNLTTLGTVTNVNSTDLNVEDKFILLNSGSSTGNSGLIVQTSATVGQGSALFWDDATDRWSLDFGGADATADTATADAYVAAVVTSDDANYQKVGNIRVDTGTGEAFIYVA